MSYEPVQTIFCGIFTSGDFMHKKIRDLREDRDLKQKDIAEYLNCSQRAYSNYELENRNIPTEVLIKLADFYDVSIDYLLGQTKNPRRNK